MQKIRCVFGGNSHSTSRGFALPTVLIASMILLTMLTVAVGAVNSSRVALQGQYYSQLAKEASEAGLQMARACIEEGYLTWDEPLRPGSDCYGSSVQCTTPECFIVDTPTLRTSFQVPSPTLVGDINSVEARGFAERIRESTGATWKQYESSMRLQDTVSEVNPGNEIQWKDIAVGGPHTCAVSYDDALYCWGYNENGQIGDGTTQHRSTPTPVQRGAIPEGVTVKELTLGRDHSCILGSDDWMYCWGKNTSGQLGDNSTTNRTTPVAVQRGAIPTGLTIAKMAKMAQDTSCAIASNGRAYCWGYNEYGQVGGGTKSTTPSLVPVAVVRGAMPADVLVSDITAGYYHSCAVGSNSRTYCWGYNSVAEGRLGSNTGVTESLTPVAVVRGAMPADMTVGELNAGLFHTCAVGSDSAAYCWGRNTRNQNGDNTATNNLLPAAVVRGAMPADGVTSQLSVGTNHGCALASDSKAYCWGMNSVGQVGDGTVTDSPAPAAVVNGELPAGVTFTKVSSGHVHSCGLGSNAKIYCWGSNNQGRLGIGLLTEDVHYSSPKQVRPVYSKEKWPVFRQVTAGTNHTCAIATDAQVYCWGYNNGGQLGDGSTTSRAIPKPISQGVIPSGVTARQISAGSSHTCMLASNNQVYCWGSGSVGQLGGGTLSNSTAPVAIVKGDIPSHRTISQLSEGSGGNHTCVIASDKKAYCWGMGQYGRLGDGAAVNRSSPVLVQQGAIPSGAAVHQITTSYYHTCALASNNQTYCWGLNSSGQLGDGTANQRLTPVAVVRGELPNGVTLRKLSSRAVHTCAVASDGRAYCWGSGAFGQLGAGASVVSASSPVAVVKGAIPANDTIRQISVGAYHTCALTSSSNAYCWGMGGSGQLGNAATANASTPVAVSAGVIPSGVTLRQIGVGSDHACAVASNTQAYCWGMGGSGQLGDGATANKSAPAQVTRGTVPSGVTTQQVSAGGTSVCSVNSNGRSYCWGSGSLGELGNGAYSQYTTPASVTLPGGVPFRQVSAGLAHACAISIDEKAYCWGGGSVNQLGNGSTGNRTTPHPVSNGALPANTVMKQIASGDTFTCAIASNSKAYCWGLNYTGQLGNGGVGAPTPSAVLQGAIPAGVTFRQIDTGEVTACAVASNAWVYCWGGNGFGQVGDGTTSNASTPAAVLRGAIPAGLTVQQVSLGKEHACAIASDNKAYCWGAGSSGQLGNNATADASSPVAVSQGAIPTGVTIRQISAGMSHTCAVASNNKAYCWGSASSYELGNSSTLQRNTPIAVSPGAMPSTLTVRQITAGNGYTCAIGSDNATYCWGLNTNGQLGDGTTTQRLAPARVVNNYDPVNYLPSYLLIGPRRYF